MPAQCAQHNRALREVFVLLGSTSSAAVEHRSAESGFTYGLARNNQSNPIDARVKWVRILRT